MIIYKHQDKQFCNNPKAILYKSLGVWFGGLKKGDLVIDKKKQKQLAILYKTHRLNTCTTL